MFDRRNRVVHNVAIFALVIAYAPIVFSFCGHDELDAKLRCETQMHRNTCSCVKIHDFSGCYIYGKQNFQCRWN